VHHTAQSFDSMALDGNDHWIQDNDFSDIDDASRGPLDDDNEINLPVPDDVRNDY